MITRDELEKRKQFHLSSYNTFDRAIGALFFDLAADTLYPEMEKYRIAGENFLNAFYEARRRYMLENQEVVNLEKENERLKMIIRANSINDQEPIERSQEATHYNWLDNQNEKLEQRVADLERKLAVCKEDLKSISEIKNTEWPDRIHVAQSISQECLIKIEG